LGERKGKIGLGKKICVGVKEGVEMGMGEGGDMGRGRVGVGGELPLEWDDVVALGRVNLVG
jgi:hypothetical protein